MASKHKEHRNQQRFPSLTAPPPKLRKQKIFQKCDESTQSGCCAMFPSLYSAPTRLWWGLSSESFPLCGPAVWQMLFFINTRQHPTESGLSPQKGCATIP